MALLVEALLVPGHASAVETTVTHWTFSLPYWEFPDRGGGFGGYSSGSFDIHVDNGSITVHDLHMEGFVFKEPAGGSPDDVYSPWWETSAGPTGVSVVFRGPCDYCDPFGDYTTFRYEGGMGIEVDGDLTRPSPAIPVSGGGFNYWVGHYSWYYGYFAAGPDSFVVGEVPEPATWAMVLAGLAALGTGARRRRMLA